MSFIKGLAATSIPSRIDKSLLRNMSGTNQSTLIAALKWFDLIDETGAHGAKLKALVDASESPGPVLRELVPAAYKFMNDGTLDLSRATGAMVEEKFKAYGLSGETIVKAMSFFIAACREAGIPVSAHIKLPKINRPNGASKAKKGRAATADDDTADDEDDEADGGASAVMKFEIPIPINRKVKISIPSDFNDDDWTLLQAMFTAYITRWKTIKAKPDGDVK